MAVDWAPAATAMAAGYTVEVEVDGAVDPPEATVDSARAYLNDHNVFCSFGIAGDPVGAWRLRMEPV